MEFTGFNLDLSPEALQSCAICSPRCCPVTPGASLRKTFRLVRPAPARPRSADHRPDAGGRIVPGHG